MRLLVIALLVIGCKAGAKTRVAYVDPSTGYTIKHNENMLNKRGEIGDIHPAVIEYVLAAEEGPLTAYYDLVLALKQPPPRVAADLHDLRAAATQLAAGKPPTGRDYARVLARNLAPHINRALEHSAQRGKLFEGSVFSNRPSAAYGETYEGTAALWWGDAADLEQNILLHDYEREYGATSLRTVIYRYASIGIVIVRSSGTEREYAWDVSRVSGAFDPKAALDVATVAKQIVALHPFTTTPARSR